MRDAKRNRDGGMKILSLRQEPQPEDSVIPLNKALPGFYNQRSTRDGRIRCLACADGLTPVYDTSEGFWRHHLNGKSWPCGRQFGPDRKTPLTEEMRNQPLWEDEG